MAVPRLMHKRAFLSRMETFAKPIHAVLSNYGYNTAQDRSRIGGNPLAKISHDLTQTTHLI